MRDVIRIEDHYYILATSDRAADCTRVLKQGETFAVFDCHGDIQPFGLGEQGIYHEGTRFLSRLELSFAGVRPLLLGSAINRENQFLAVDLMNPDFFVDEVQVHRDSIHVFRSKLIWKGTCFEQLRITNFSLGSLQIPFSIRFEADYADIFEVRGTKRPLRGKLLEPLLDHSSVTLSYRGIDRVLRNTLLSFSPRPQEVHGSEVRYVVTLDPKESISIQVSITCECGECERFEGDFGQAICSYKEDQARMASDFCDIFSDNEHFNTLLYRGRSDLLMMMTNTEHGIYPYAGVPWFSTTFGRDGIITALEMLWVNPHVAKGVLSYLAQTQSNETNREQDAEPGKIIHETRLGEMAALGEIPFGCYYGSVDSTPLFVMLAGAWYQRTGDIDFIHSIWPNILRALEWIDTYGDGDDDGFVEYSRTSSNGLLQQGWKDSNDSVFHADGTLADGPIALCEVQGYVYEAKLQAAELAEAVGETGHGQRLRNEAAILRQNFIEKFWSNEISTLSLALDGAKRPCMVRASNAGHCLYSGIVDNEHAHIMAEQFMSDIFYSGWGVRTVATSEKRYNPMSYHNGSIWPHDNAIIASGLARYGHTREAATILESIFSASQGMDLHRLPELYCGFKKRDDFRPILYPLACAPQAWAAASVYLLLQACTGLTIHAGARQVRFLHPVLPSFLDELRICNLQVQGSSLDILLKRYHRDVTVSVVRKDGPIEVVITK